MKKKGITPVIAVVLLLLITVGAVGSAFGLYQQLRSQAQGQTEKLDAAQKAANTEIRFVSTFNQSVNQALRGTNNLNDTTRFVIRNEGNRAIDMEEELTLELRPERESEPLSTDQFTRIYKGDWLQNGYGSNGQIGKAFNCFNNMADSNQTLPKGGEYTCATNVDFPEVGESITFVVKYSATGKTWTKTCTRTSVTSRTC